MIEKQFYTLRQAAAFLGICEKKARHSWLGWSAYDVKPVTPGRNIVFKKIDIQKIKDLRIYG